MHVALFMPINGLLLSVIGSIFCTVIDIKPEQLANALGQNAATLGDY